MFVIPGTEQRMYGSTDRRLVVIQADDTPSTFPFTGETVTGLDDNASIARGSLLWVVSTKKVYVMNETEDAWYENGGGTTPVATKPEEPEEPGE